MNLLWRNDMQEALTVPELLTAKQAAALCGVSERRCGDGPGAAMRLRH